jgi:hypothetical protein
MKHIQKFENYSEVNEEFLGDLLKAAKGALKNFVTGVMTPFKAIKDDFKKGLKFEQLKTKFIQSLDTMLKNATASIQKAKDENEINQMNDAVIKELDDKMAEFDKEIQTIKESRVHKIYEADEATGANPNDPTAGGGNKIQNALIAGRVLFSLLKDEYTKRKQEFDKKFAAAKDLNAKKQVAITNLKSLIDGYKKKINDPAYIKQATDKYKTDNKIANTPAAGGASEEVLKSYGVKTAEELVKKTVKYKTKEYDNTKKPEDQEDKIASGDVLEVKGDDITIHNPKTDGKYTKKLGDLLPGGGDQGGDNAKKAAEVLGKIKGDEKKMGQVVSFAEFISKPENDAKVGEIEKIIGAGQPAA